MARASAELSRLRSASKNALRLGILCFPTSTTSANSGSFTLSGHLRVSVTASRIKKLRSVPDIMEFEHRELVEGQIFAHMNATCKLIGDEVALRRCGICVDGVDDLQVLAVQSQGVPIFPLHGAPPVNFSQHMGCPRAVSVDLF